MVRNGSQYEISKKRQVIRVTCIVTCMASILTCERLLCNMPSGIAALSSPQGVMVLLLLRVKGATGLAVTECSSNSKYYGCEGGCGQQELMAHWSHAPSGSTWSKGFL